MKDFLCYYVTKEGRGPAQAEVTRRSLGELPAGDVLIRVAYSSLNYKDALSATGHPGVTRKFPHVPGIDSAGTVVESRADEWNPGDEVLATSYDLGQNTWGGYAEYVRVPAAWVVRRPEGLTLREAMILGTAGFTAGMGLDALVERGITPARGEIVVTGASGGVGSLAVAILAKAGYQVVASTGKASAHELLRQLGAAEIIGREDVLDESDKPLLAARWAGGIDTVGGKTLATLVRSAQHNGCITACGLVGGVDLPLTVYPFILRGIELAGIDSAECPRERRLRVWQKLADEWKPDKLEELAVESSLSQLGGHIQEILKGRVTGRVLVKPTA
ncbi:MAG TPA: YhdH/YhfP family quinone oxidoreductase [Pirellulales bacterium]|nr:YhdH/YhfP family quinone oxidoreductase [Pirellulales bacterium]